MYRVELILIHWGLFTGPKFFPIIVPDGKPQTKDQEAENLANAARQQAEQESYRASMGAGNLNQLGARLPPRCACQCCRHGQQRWGNL